VLFRALAIRLSLLRGGDSRETDLVLLAVYVEQRDVSPSATPTTRPSRISAQAVKLQRANASRSRERMRVVYAVIADSLVVMSFSVWRSF